MTRSELVLKLAKRRPHLQLGDVERILDRFFREIASALSQGDRVELRGFGAFTVRRLEARADRNPATGAVVDTPLRYYPKFKPGKPICDRINKPT
jgi:integration host factor subunit beta